jgi:hypothetical protein
VWPGRDGGRSENLRGHSFFSMGFMPTWTFLDYLHTTEFSQYRVEIDFKILSFSYYVQAVASEGVGGAGYAHHSTTSPPPRIFRPCDGPDV